MTVLKIISIVYLAFSIFMLGWMSDEIKRGFREWRWPKATCYFLVIFSISVLLMVYVWVTDFLKWAQQALHLPWYWGYYVRKIDITDPERIRKMKVYVWEHSRGAKQSLSAKHGLWIAKRYYGLVPKDKEQGK